MELKWVALVALVVQNSGLAIAMRYTFLLAASDPNSRYISSTAVLAAEVMKLVIASFACYYEDARCNKEEFFRILYTEFVDNRVDFFKLMIPSFLYTIQNTLQYFSMSCLSAPVFQVLYQMKIITTAIFSVLLLSKRISSFQWISILSLAVGVALVQLSQSSGHAESAGKTNSIAGLISVMCGCLTSGFAGNNNNNNNNLIYNMIIICIIRSSYIL
jgi:solute carrier family 35 (UDP-sugar transporter), member A1/2/3